jgi:peptidoglycan/LPS O-acetylase OafA/YrhL
MPPDIAEPLSGRRPALDGLRGIAILLVLSFHWIFASLPGWHSPELTLWESLLRHATMLDWIGVDLFFVLSGFLIGGIIFDNRDAANFFSVFYIRRGFRILPLYFVLLAAFALGYRLIPWSGDPALRAIFDGTCQKWAYLTFTQNIYCLADPTPELAGFGLGNTWSLAVEEQFYLLAPAALYWLSSSRVPRWLLGGILLAFLIRVYFFFIADIDTYAKLPTRMDTLLTGVLCAWAVRDPAWSAWLGRNLHLVRRAAAAMLCVLGIFIIERWSAGHKVMESFGFTMVALLGGCCVLIAVYDPPRFLSSSTLRLFGTGSYCIYLFHRPVGMMVHRLLLGRKESIADLPGLAATVTSLGLICAIAWLSWIVLERPALRLGHRFRYARSEPAPLIRMGVADTAGASSER